MWAEADCVEYRRPALQLMTWTIRRARNGNSNSQVDDGGHDFGKLIIGGLWPSGWSHVSMQSWCFFAKLVSRHHPPPPTPSRLLIMLIGS